MKTPKEKLIVSLENRGWRLENIYIADLEWWADEIWEMRSVWSPEGVPAYITFLVDPQYEEIRRKGQAVWGVGSSGKYPASLAQAQSNGVISLNEISKNRERQFIENVDSFRSGAIDDMG
ncbi:MAG: hypothetical protein AAF699_16700 [Pseudomonadota bacterium]